MASGCCQRSHCGKQHVPLSVLLFLFWQFGLKVEGKVRRSGLWQEVNDYPATALSGDRGTGSRGGRGKSLLGEIRGQLAGREVRRVRTKCSVHRRLCRVTCQVLAEVMRHGSPHKPARAPGREQDPLSIHQQPQNLPARKVLSEVLHPGQEIQGLLHT